MPVVVLGVICLLVAVLLAAVNAVTDPIIKDREAQKVYDSLRVVIDGYFEPVTELPESTPKSVTAMYRVTDGDELVGHAVTVSVKGYKGPILITVGVDADGNVTKAVVTSEAETHGQAGMKNYTDNYTGVAKDDLSSVELFSGATVTSTAIRDGIIDAVNAAMGLDVPEKEEPNYDKTNEELLAVIAELLPTADVEDVEFNGEKYVRRVYRDNNGEGYFIYVLVISENYGTVESEALLHIGTDGAIKNLKTLTWKTSDAIYGYVPPTEEAVNAFYDRIINTNATTIEGVELVTNATNTSTNVIASFTEALNAANKLIKKEMPTPEADVFAIAEQLAGATLDLENVTPEGLEYTRRIYRDKNGKGYFVYTVVINERYQRIETETLVHIGTNGKIKAVEKMIWKTSDAGWGYEPPADELVVAFYDSLIGANLAKLEELNTIEVDANPDGLLVTGATSTSKGLLTALIEGIGCVVELLKTDLPTPEEELLAIAEGMVGEGATFTDVTPDANTFVKKIYRENSGKGYIAYTVVINERYQRVETETLIYVGTNGKIKNIARLTWKTSDAGWGYEPPAEELVVAFYDSLIGANLTKLEELNTIEVDANPDGLLVTGATSTSKGLLTALIEGVGHIAQLLKTDLPTAEEELLDIAVGMVGEGATFTDVTPTDTTYVKKLYRENSGKGYIAYMVVVNERYQRVETETLIYVGMDGKIRKIERLTWKTSDAGWGYEPPAEELVVAFYDSLIGADLAKLKELNTIEVGANPDGLLVTGATSTSKGLLTALIEGVENIKTLLAGDLPTPESELLGIATGMVGEGATFTDVTPDENTYVKKIYRDNGGRGYIVYTVVINERYQRVETETLIYVGMDGKIKNIARLTWKTSDAGWGYEPPVEELVVAFYDSLIGADLAKLEELNEIEVDANPDGLLVTGATSTSKGLLTALIEGVKSAKALIAMDMPTLESEVLDLADQLVGAETDFENVTPEGLTYVRRIYRDKNGNGYVAYIVVINERYGRVETETLVYIGNDGKIKAINRLTWKTSDAGWGYEPPAEELVVKFYDSLIGADLAKINELNKIEVNANPDGLLVTGATSTTKGLLTALAEALEATNELIIKYTEPDYTARIIGISILAAALVVSVAAAIVIKKKRGGKNG